MGEMLILAELSLLSANTSIWADMNEDLFLLTDTPIPQTTLLHTHTTPTEKEREMSAGWQSLHTSVASSPQGSPSLLPKQWDVFTPLTMWPHLVRVLYTACRVPTWLKKGATSTEANFSEVWWAESVQTHTLSLNNNEFSPVWKVKAAVIDILTRTADQIVMCNVKGVAWADPPGINEPVLHFPLPTSFPGVFGMVRLIALVLSTATALIHFH